MEILITKSDWKPLEAWIEKNGWYLIRRDGFWTADIFPKTLLAWEYTFVTPSGNKVKVRVEE